MNLSVLKTTGFWVTAVTVIAGLMISSGLVLDGSKVDMIIGWIMSIAGVLGGHQLAAPKAAEPTA
jgi:hypothetical protein